MKILLISYRFYPEINPRSFRTYELSREFASRGHYVKVIIPKYDYDYSELMEKYPIKIQFININKEKYDNLFIKKDKFHKSYALSNKKSKVKKILKPLFNCLFPSGRSSFYFFPLFKTLIKEKGNFDLIIAISFPFSVLTASALAFVFNKNISITKVKIAEYSDPLTSNSNLPNCFLYKLVDKFISSKFNYIVTHTEKAINTFLKYKDMDHIKIIPQGMDFSEVKIAKYQKNKIPTFGYAGIFYKKIRNPEKLLKYLKSININFKFIIYTDLNHSETAEVTLEYTRNLKDKIILMPLLPRLEVIHELSKMDFLINIDNLSSNQTPSKLIDYALTKRPIYSFRQNNFDIEEFNKYLFGEYPSNKINIELENYDIKNVCNKFLELI